MTNDKIAQEQIEKITKAASQQAEEMAAMNKAGFDAWMQSTNILMDGATNLYKAVTDYSNNAREHQAATMKQFMSCKTLNDMTEVSTKVAQESVEKMMSASTELSEKSIKIYMDSMQPINDQVSKTMQTAANKTKAA